MEFINGQTIQRIIQLTWRNPAFMALSIALLWLIPQFLIRKILEKKYKERQLIIQKKKIDRLYPKK